MLVSTLWFMEQVIHESIKSAETCLHFNWFYSSLCGVGAECKAMEQVLKACVSTNISHH